MYQRFFSAKDEKEAKKAVIGWVIGVILIGICLQSIAVIGSSMFKGLPANESGKIIALSRLPCQGRHDSQRFNAFSNCDTADIEPPKSVECRVQNRSKRRVPSRVF